MQLGSWAKHDGTGATFDSSGGFVHLNGAVRSPDASWVKLIRLATLTDEQCRKFVPLCPEFVVELSSPSDSLAALQAKMQEYLENGVKLRWLIDPENRRVYAYRPREPVRALKNSGNISGDPVLPGFVLDLREIW